MGGKSSKQNSTSSRRRRTHYLSHGSSSSSSSGNVNLSSPSPSHQVNPYYTPQHHHATPRYDYHNRPQTPQHEHACPRYTYESPAPQLQWKLDNKYLRIADNYQTLEQVTAALAQAGLESSNLIVGIDLTKSNEWTGVRSFNRKSLHHIGICQNPYEQAISIIGKTLSAFDEDNLIPCFGFGDATTHDRDVFSFYPDGIYCIGFEDVLRRYREIVPRLKLAGPTSFAPIIEMAMTIVEESFGQYHVLLIIADGQVTRSVDTNSCQLSPQERKTIDAIVKASEYPLSIILVGVGDGPWDMMREFDDNIPSRAFDNFQFVNFTEIMLRNIAPQRKQTEFALAALMEIPSQYKATIELNILGRQTGNAPNRVPRPPPVHHTTPFTSGFIPYNSRNFEQNAAAQAATSSTSISDNQICSICLVNAKNMAFGCGHQTCGDCGADLQTCHMCRSIITTRIKLFA